MMYFILSWVVYGLLVGLLAKAIHRGDDPVGFIPTVVIGIIGSYVGGFISWLIGFGVKPFESSGIFMGVVGGVIFCSLYRNYKLGVLLEAQRNKNDK